MSSNRNRDGPVDAEFEIKEDWSWLVGVVMVVVLGVIVWIMLGHVSSLLRLMG